MEDEVNSLTVKVGITDELFQQGVTNLNRSMNLLKSEFKATSSSLESFGSSTEKLGAKADFLEKSIEIQKQKVTSLKDAYESAKSKTGEFSSATQNAGTRLNNAISYLNKLDSKLKDTKEQLAATSAEENKINWKEHFESASNAAENTKSKISGVKNAIVGITATVAGGAGLYQFASSAIDAGNNAYQLSNRLGITSEEAVNLSKMLSLAGVDTNSFTGTMTRLDKSVLSAGKSGNTTTKALSEFGVKLTDAHGKMLPMTDQLGVLAQAYQKSSDAGNEDAFTSQVLGQRGTELIPILQDYTEVKEKAAKQVGIGVDPKQAHEVSIELNQVKSQFAQLGTVAAKEVLPIVSAMLPPTIKFFQEITQEIKNNKTQIDSFVQNIIRIGQVVVSIVEPPIKELFTFIASHGTATEAIVFGLGSAFLVFKTVTGTIHGIVGAIQLWEDATKAQAAVQTALNVVLSANPIGLVVLAIAGLVAGLVFAYNKCEWFRNGVNSAFSAVKNSAVTIFGDIKSFLSKWGLDILTVFVPFIGIPLQIRAHWSSIIGFFSGIGAGIKAIWRDMWSLKIPHIPLPHFSLSGSFSLNPPKIPSIGVNWYAKGGIFNRPSLIGVGESGKEAVMPLENNTAWIDELAGKLKGKINGNDNTPTYVIVQIDGKGFARAIAKPMSAELAQLDNNSNLAFGKK